MPDATLTSPSHDTPVTRAQALQRVLDALNAEGTSTSDVRELSNGWLVTAYPANSDRPERAIVNKTTGKVLRLDSSFPVERDVKFYEQGYVYDEYDLVILRASEETRTVEVLFEIGIARIEVTYAEGRVWRTARHLSKRSLRRRIQNLPEVFERVRLYQHLERLEEGRARRWFEFKALAYPGDGRR